ncbi:MAG: DHHW family protein, partial [Bacilli bacterium]
MNTNKQRYTPYIMIVPFLTVIFSVGVANILSSDKEISTFENRKLTTLPNPSVENVVEGEYMLSFETYFTDQFVFRDTLIKTNSAVKLLINKPVVNDFYITSDGYMLPAKQKGDVSKTELTPESITTAVDQLNSFSETMIEEGSEVYYFMTPHRTTSLQNSYPSYITAPTTNTERELFINQ